MPKPRSRQSIFTLSPVDYRQSGIEGRGVFARRRFQPGDVVVPYAPRQRRIDASDPEADAASLTKLTLLTPDGSVIVPDTSVPGGWLCNHGCDPNAILFSSGEGRIQSLRTIAPGEEVTIFYGWVSQNEPGRDPCRCGAASCRGFINFDLTDEDARLFGGDGPDSDALYRRLEEYGEFLDSIGQEHVRRTIADTLERRKRSLTGGTDT